MKHLKIVSRPNYKQQFIISEEDKIWGILSKRVLFSFIGTESEPDVSEEVFSEILSEMRKYAWHRLLDYLAVRERTIRECKVYFRKLLLNPEIGDELIRNAVDRGYIDNQRYAELLVHSLAEKGKSRIEIKMKLKQAGIDATVVAEAMKEHFPIEVEKQILIDTAKKSLDRFRKLPPREQFQKCMEYMVRRGFSYEASRAALQKIGKLEEGDEW
jgi:SOS response regulatory protein OraA/RecX